MRFEDLTGKGSPLLPEDISAAAALLKISTAHVKAVDEVESNGRGFHPETRRPIILYEPHVFSRRTGHRFDASHPEVSYLKWKTRPYPATQGQRYEQLRLAMTLAEGAALQSASWGRYQIMGFNSALCGFESVQSFALAMARSEGDQLRAFVRFVGSQPAMLAALRKGDWAGFAQAYNGEGFAQHGYDQKLKAAFARHTARASA